jgi:hypothetical protein
MIKSTPQLNVLVGLLQALAFNASATTYTNVPSGANTGSPFAYFGNSTSGGSGNSPKVGEVFSLTSAATLSFLETSAYYRV